MDYKTYISFNLKKIQIKFTNSLNKDKTKDIIKSQREGLQTSANQKHRHATASSCTADRKEGEIKWMFLKMVFG